MVRATVVNASYEDSSISADKFCYTLTRETGNHLGGVGRSSGDFLDAFKSDMTVEGKVAPLILLSTSSLQQ